MCCLGVGHILAEDFSERADLRGRLRRIVKKTGHLVSAKTEIAEQQGKEFRDYFEFKELLNKIPPHRVLAINRGERAKMLRVKIDADDAALWQETEAIAGAGRSSACRISCAPAPAMRCSGWCCPAWSAKFAAK